MKKVLLTFLCMLLLTSTLQAAEFEDSGALLDLRLHELDTAIQELDQRLKALENGDPPVDPPIDPPIDPPVVGIEPGQDPFVQHRIPGYIQAEDYDLGGNGIAYLDLTPGNVGGVYRTDDVDIKTITGVNTYAIGWTRDTEWLEYTVGAKAGNYDLHVRVSNGTSQSKSLRIYISGEIVAQLQISSTGDWEILDVIRVRDINIPESTNIMLKLEVVDGPFDIDHVRFVTPGTSFNNTPTDILMCPPGWNGVDLSDCV